MAKRLLAVLSVAAAVFGGVTVAGANPDPNGPAKHGMCTAYYNGSDNKHHAGPFQDLEAAADDGDDSNGDDVARFCEGMIGGKPENRG